MSAGASNPGGGEIDGTIVLTTTQLAQSWSIECDVGYFDGPFFSLHFDVLVKTSTRALGQPPPGEPVMRGDTDDREAES